ncbi:MAG: nicotinate phosphoribosyltransferase [Epsilonproteobacteria bacterium]|nr:nicotinate phosphoribosyltransferase [Campylobacterota bacterium]NPA64955.1 phosphoribosyltransferase [Campylobacterota bacterium]
MRYYPYKEFVQDLKKLSHQIDYDYDAIVAIGRGGMTMAHMLGELWDERRVYTLNSIAYEDTKKLDGVEIFNIPDLTEAKRVLVVDDIVDSGDTMEAVVKALKERFKQLDIDVAALFYKPAAGFRPTYYLHETREWIDFFWTRDIR